MAYDLAVTYAMLKMGKKEFYSYCSNTYQTKYQMLEEIIEDHPFVSRSKIILLNIGTYRTPENFQRTVKYIYENPFPVIVDKKLSPVVIQEFCYLGITYYYCFHKVFKDYKKATIYARFMGIKVRFDFKNKYHPKVPKELDVQKKVGYIGFSDRVWRRIWKNCYYYKCFAAHDFLQFKLKLLYEMNYYRMKHNAKPVKIKKLATQLAEAYLKSILNEELKFTDNRVLQYYESLPYYFAPLLFKKWYDESKYYRYGTKEAIPGTEHFTAMVWKAVKNIGIAVREVNEMFHMLVVFEPLPNGVNLFSSNVKKRKYKIFG
uniref:SCP domain-containing protein n=1 Tax=Strongyloides venezuelensis TaxID=75913 RepID=A0A0K0G222_STRVS